MDNNISSVKLLIFNTHGGLEEGDISFMTD